MESSDCCLATNCDFLNGLGGGESSVSVPLAAGSDGFLAGTGFLAGIGLSGLQRGQCSMQFSRKNGVQSSF